MIRTALVFSLAAMTALPAFAAETKEQSCEYQAQIVSAIQQARLDRVKERNVPKHIADTNPTWPENYNAAIPIMTPWVYEQKMRDVKNNDLGAAWKELCVQQ